MQKTANPNAGASRPPVLVAVAIAALSSAIVFGVGLTLAHRSGPSPASKGVERTASDRDPVAETPASTSNEASDERSPAPVAEPALPAPPAPPAAGALTPVEALSRALASTDDAKKLKAIDDVVHAGNTEALPVLTAVELEYQPEAAPKVIRGIASLAKSSRSQADKTNAVDTLAGWLRQETTRQGRDAAGNVVNLVESIGTLGGRGATDALIRALDDQRLDLSVETLAVEQLGALGDPRAEEAIARVGERLRTMPAPSNPFDEQLRREGLEATETSLRTLAR